MSAHRSGVTLTRLLTMVVVAATLAMPSLPAAARGAQGFDPAPSAGAPVTVKLRGGGGDDVGAVGWVFLSSPPDGGQTFVWAILSRAEPRPVHIYRGSCDDEGATPTYPLTGVDAVGESETAVAVRLADLLATEHVIKVHESVENMGALLACERIAPGSPGDGATLAATGVTANKDEVTHRPPAGDEALLALDVRQAVQTGDAINVREAGEGWLTFPDYLLVRIFRDSNLAITIEGEVDPAAPPLVKVELTAGTVMGSRSELQTMTEQRVTVTTQGAVITATGTRFLAHYDPRTELTWVVVARGEVELSAAGETVTVEPGWQSWVRRGEEPEAPVPATRAALESRFPGVFPPLEELTIDALREDGLLGAKRCVVDTDRLNLRAGAGTSFAALETMPRGAVFRASNWNADLSWVYGESETGRVGWASAELLACTYPPPPLVVEQPAPAPRPTAVPRRTPSPRATETPPPPAPEDEPPSAPCCLAATAPPEGYLPGEAGVELSWEPSTDDNGLDSYHIYRGGEEVAIVGGETTSYTDFDIEPFQTYTYEVRAEDTAGQLSDVSNTATATTGPAYDAPPGAPTNLSATRNGVFQVDLAWSAASDDQGIGSYAIYRNGAHLDTVGGGTTSYSDNSLDCNEGASYVVYAFDTSGQGSGGSNEAGVGPNNCGIN